jgi:hypothetical protein
MNPPSVIPNALIKEALSCAVKAINAGQHPTKALIKAAEEFDLNANYIQRVGEGLNVALTYSHFKKAADKSTNFPIADINETIKVAFDSKDKTKAEKKSEWFQTSELHVKHANYNKIVDNELYKVAYEAIIASGKGAEDFKFPMSFKGVIEKSAQYIRNLKKDLEKAKTEKIAADTKLDRAFGSLVRHFSRSEYDRTPWHDIESQVFAKHGEEAVPFLESVYKEAGLKEDRGVHDAKHWNFNDCKEAAMFETLFNAGKGWVAAEEKLADAEHNYNFEKEYHDSIWVKEHTLKKSEEIVTTEPTKEAAAPIEDEAEKLAFSLLDTLMNKFHESIDSKNDKKSNPLANTSGDNLQRKTVLQELVMTDPILAKEPPQKVVSAYQQIMRVAPQLSKEKEVVRSMLREMMATQSLNPHTSNMFTEADVNLMKQRLMTHGVSQGK